MAAVAREDGDADARPRVPQPHALVLGGGEQQRRVHGVEAAVVDRVAVAHQRAVEAAVRAVDDLRDASLAADREERRVAAPRPRAAEERLVLVVVDVELPQLHRRVVVAVRRADRVDGAAVRAAGSQVVERRIIFSRPERDAVDGSPMILLDRRDETTAFALRQRRRLDDLLRGLLPLLRHPSAPPPPPRVVVSRRSSQLSERRTLSTTIHCSTLRDAR
mmetsp:Transcript_7192/g.21097  ORF Transcript_7192/g.21097 Transcript_7192/m.21097 type:complete len:219 (+) Transcript_7192:624-1280(+)